jgi:hypothetical protein
VNDHVEKWWQGLSPQERTEAMRARKEGALSEGLAESLRRAGLKSGKPGDPLPGEVERFLKARH